MKISRLEYCKLILQKVSFERKLFRKEYKKSLRILPIDEALSLRLWIKRQLRIIKGLSSG
jgi:hypothetical protein